MKRVYCKPVIEIENFVANEYISLCATIDCIRNIDEGDVVIDCDATKSVIVFAGLKQYQWDGEVSHAQDEFTKAYGDHKHVGWWNGTFNRHS